MDCPCIELQRKIPDIAKKKCQKICKVLDNTGIIANHFQLFLCFVVS